ncbi:MAG: hypothetical protein WDZ63_08550 [Burkholderiales bacterium]
MAIVTVVLLAAAAYTHLRIPRHTKGTVNRAVLRGILIAVGIAFGYVTTTYYTPADGVRTLLAFLSAFGLVHVPAAAILFLKRQRGEGQS